MILHARIAKICIDIAIHTMRYLEKCESWLVEAGVKKVATCKGPWSGNGRCGRRWLVTSSGTWGAGGHLRWVCCVCVCRRGSVRQRAVFSFIHASTNKVTHSKCEVGVMPKSLPTMSFVMAHAHVVKTSVMEELTVTILKYLHSVSWQHVTLS